MPFPPEKQPKIMLKTHTNFFMNWKSTPKCSTGSIERSSGWILWNNISNLKALVIFENYSIYAAQNHDCTRMSPLAKVWEFACKKYFTIDFHDKIWLFSYSGQNTTRKIYFKRQRSCNNVFLRMWTDSEVLRTLSYACSKSSSIVYAFEKKVNTIEKKVNTYHRNLEHRNIAIRM